MLNFLRFFSFMGIAFSVTISIIFYQFLHPWRPNDHIYYPDPMKSEDIFRKAANSSGFKLHFLQIAGTRDINVAVLPGSNDKVLLHFSGVHGVEGHAGLAIQLQAFDALKNGSIPMDNIHSDRPTLVFVHPMNPFGFYNGRRWNKNNVDLNRNYNSDEKFIELIRQDIHSYWDIDHTINPTTAPSLYSWLTDPIIFIWTIIQWGFPHLKKSIIQGQYVDPKKLYYGGQHLEDEHKAIRNFLLNQPFINATYVVAIDVHTGLGPRGKDSLMGFCLPVPRYYTNSIFGKGSGSIGSGDASGKKLFMNTVGYFLTGLFDLFPNTHLNKSAFVMQEFGTIPPIFVFSALRYENCETQYGIDNLLRYRKMVRDAFYIPELDWQISILERGDDVLRRGIEYLAHKQYTG